MTPHINQGPLRWYATEFDGHYANTPDGVLVAYGGALVHIHDVRLVVAEDGPDEDGVVHRRSQLICDDDFDPDVWGVW